MAILPVAQIGLVGPEGPAGPTGDQGPAGLGAVWTVVEVDVSGGTGAPRRSGSFTIAGVGLTAGKMVQVQVAVGPWTGKGSLADEAEMDMITAHGSVTNPTTITVYWHAPTWVKGNVKFAYAIGG